MSTASTALNIAVLTPMPSASVAMDDGRKRRIAADLTQSVTDIPRDLVQPGAAASGSDAFFRLLHAAKMEYGQAARVAWRRPVANPVGEGHVDKGLQLVIQILLDSVPMNQPAYD